MKEQLVNSNDLELWKSFKKGNKGALKTIYISHFKHLYNYGRKFSSNKVLVENCVQDLYIELIQNKERLGDTDNIRMYLLTAIKRKIIRRLQQEKKVLKLDFSLIQLSSIAKPITSDADEINIRENILLAINQLSDQQKEIIYLKYFNFLGNKEIAEILSLNYQTVRNVLVTALKKLRKSMSAFIFFSF